MAYPLIYSSLTGRWEEVAPETSEEAFGIPIGPPVQYSSDIHEPPGGLEVPGSEPPPYYNPEGIERQTSTGRKPQLFASTESGVPSGYDPEEDTIPLEGEKEDTPELPPEMEIDEPAQPVRLPPGMVIDEPEEKPEELKISYSGELYPEIARQREHLFAEIDSNPKLREYLAAVISQEAGKPEGILATTEALFNRTQQRRSSIAKELTNGFYGPVNSGWVDRIVKRGVEPWMYDNLDNALDAVRNGSDIAEGRTDQGGYDEIKGPVTKIGDEYFGYMGGDPTWSMHHQRNKGEPGPALYARGSRVPGLIPLPEGMEIDEGQVNLPQGMEIDEEEKPQAGIDAVIAEAKEAGLIVTSGYRSPSDPLSRANPKSAHTQGLAFDLRAKTGDEADDVMAKQRELFTKRGMEEGVDYKIIDEVRRPSRHATGPHVHVQLTEGGMGRYTGGQSDVTESATKLPPGVEIDEDQGLPPGVEIDEDQEAPKTLATGPVRSTEGEMPPKLPKWQESAIAAQFQPSEELPRLTPEATRELPIRQWIDRESGREVRRAEMVEGGLPISARKAVWGSEQGGLPPTTKAEAIAAQEAGKPLPEGIAPPPEGHEYDTVLPPGELNKYEAWKAKYAPRDSGQDYDLRGAYAAGLTPDPKTGHWPDEFKKPNHPTFSNESKYAVGENAKLAGHWEGDKFVWSAEKFAKKLEEFGNTIPKFELTKEQKDKFKGTEVEKYPDVQKQIVAANIASENPAVKPTKEQKDWVEGFKTFERRPVGFFESAGKGIVSAAAGTAEVIEELGKKYGFAKPGQYPKEHPNMAGVFALKGMPREKQPKQIDPKVLDKSVEDLKKFREGFKIDPEKETQNFLGILGTGAGTLGVDYATAVLMPGAQAKEGAGWIQKAIKGGYSFTLPAIRDANEAYDALIKANKSKGEATLGWWEQFGKTILMTSLPLHATSASPNVVTRLLERGAKGGAIGAGIGTAFTAAENIEDYFRGEKPRGFDWKEIAASGINLGILTAITGGKGVPREKLTATSEKHAAMLKHNYLAGIEREATRRGMTAEATLAQRNETIGKVEADSPERQLQEHNDRLVEIDKRIQEISKGPIDEATAKEAVDLYNEAKDRADKADAIQKSIDARKAKEGADAKGEPATPTYEEVTKAGRTVTDNKTGKKGEVVGEEKEVLDIAWEDGTKSKVRPDEVTRQETTRTKVSNTVMLLPESGNKTSVHYYNGDGTKKSEKPIDTDKAEARAREITADKNLSGYYDRNGNFVHERGKPPEAPEVTRPAEPAKPAEPVEGTTEAPGLTPEQEARIAAGKNEPVDSGFLKRWLRVGKKSGFDAGKTTGAVVDSYSRLLAYYRKQPISEVISKLMDVRIGKNQTLREFVLQDFPHFGSKGADITFDPTEGAAGIRINGWDGRLKMNINPHKFLAELEAGEGIAKGYTEANTRLTITEELMHGAQHDMYWKRWEALSDAEKASYAKRSAIESKGMTAPFDYFHAEQAAKPIEDIYKTIQSLPASDRDAITKIGMSSYNTYKGEMARDASQWRNALLDPATFWDKLIKKADGGDITFLYEFYRQILQQQKHGIITERAMATVTAELNDAYLKVINTLEANLNDMLSQRPSDSAKFMIDAVRDDLKEVRNIYNSSLAKKAVQNYSEIQSTHATEIKDGKIVSSQDIKDFSGKTSVTRDPNTGLYKPVYRLNKGATPWGTHLGTEQAAIDLFKQKSKPGDAWVPFGSFIRLENPALVQDHSANGWNPGEVANDLMRRGYLTKQELEGALNKNGEITEHKLQQILINKNIDGFRYVNQNEGKRKLTGAEVDKIIENAIFEAQSRALGRPSNFIVRDAQGRAIGAGETERIAEKNARRILEKRSRPVDESYIVFSPSQVMSATGNAGVKGRSIVGAKARDEQSYEDKVVEAHNKNGGSSISVAHGPLAGKDFFSVEVYPEMTKRVNSLNITHKDLYDVRKRALQDNIDINTGELFLGTWANVKEGYTEIGISAAIPDIRAALEVGKEYGQQAIWDNAVGGEIYINGAMGQAHLPSISERQGFISSKARDPLTYNASNLGKVPEIKISDLEIMNAGERNEKWATWYKTWNDYMYGVSGKYPEYHPLFASFLGSTSAHRSVGSNFTLGIKAFRNFLEGRDPTTGQIGAHRENIGKTIRGIAIGGGKVPEYFPGLIGDPNAIAVDMHVGRVLFNLRDDQAVTPKMMLAGQQAIMRVADQMGWKWADLQAALFAEDLIRRGEPVRRYEEFAAAKRDEYFKLVNEDIARGGPNRQLGRTILERTSARIGPERLHPGEIGTPEGQAKIRLERAKALHAAAGIKLDPELAASISLTGPKVMGAKTRSTIPTTDFDNRVSSAADIRWVYEGAKHQLWHSPGLHNAGDAIHMHDDLLRKYRGEFKFPFFQWERDASGLLTGAANAAMGDLGRLANVATLGAWKPSWGNMGQAKAAISEHEAWRLARAQGGPLPSLSKDARELRDRTDQVISKINNKNAGLGIKIEHPDTGNYVPIPRVEYPAQVKEKTLAAMRDPQNHQPEWREWTRALVAEGILPSSATERDFVAHRDKVIGSINKNGAFGQFFFFPKTMPKTSFDYSYKAMDQFLNAYTERLAQVEAFGHTRDKDIFTHYINSTADPMTQRYLRQVQALAYGDVVNDVFGRVATFGGHVAATWHLGNPFSAIKNLMSGMTMNTLSLGPVHMAKAFFQVNPFRMIPSAVEKGILTKDLMNVMTYGEQMSGFMGMKSAGELAFKYSGYNAAENWNRGIAMVGGQSILRHAVDAYKINPRGKDVLRYMAYLQRLGFRGSRAEDVLKEGGAGPLADEYLRSMVNEIQGGYTYSNVPVYMSQPAGKALFKYQKWGAEQARHFDQEVLRPALRGAGILKREMVTVTDAAGNKTQVPVPRSYKDFIPAAAYLIGIGAAGAGMAWSLEQLFGTPDKTITLAEALAQYENEKGWHRYAGFMNKIWGYHMLMGSMGTIGNYIQSGLVWTGMSQAKQKDVSTLITESSTQAIPSLDPFIKLADAIKVAHEQGWKVGTKDLDDLANSISFYRANKQLMLTQVGRFQGKGQPYGNDVYGNIHRWSDTLANRQDLVRIRDIEKRYQASTGYEPKKGPKVAPVKGPLSIWRDPFDDALLIGDIQQARAIMQTAKRGMSPARWAMEKENLKDHIRAKQPIEPLGGEGGEKAKPDFYKWARQNLSPYDQEMIRRVDQTYRRSARHIIGMDFEKPKIEDVMEFRHQLKIEKQPTSYPNLLDPASLFQ